MVAGQWDFTCPACSAVTVETYTGLLLAMKRTCQLLTGKRPFVQAKCTSSLCGVSAFRLGQHRRATIKSAGPSAPMVLATSCKNPSHIRHPPPEQLPMIVRPNYAPAPTKLSNDEVVE
jgi:hypothetical protein